jgi:hypothetical protein
MIELKIMLLGQSGAMGFVNLSGQNVPAFSSAIFKWLTRISMQQGGHQTRFCIFSYCMYPRMFTTGIPVDFQWNTSGKLWWNTNNIYCWNTPNLNVLLANH